MAIEHTIIIGAGPCGLSCALELQTYNIRPLIIEKGNVVDTIYKFPTHQTFFSSSNKLEVGDIPFITAKHNPVRNEALTYYREVADRERLRINTYEDVISIEKNNHLYEVITKDYLGETRHYLTKHIIIATGYYDTPNTLNIPGESLPKVKHYFKEAHPYFNKNIVVIGGKNSAVDTAIELQKAGANVSVLHRRDTYSTSIKPWILPIFKSLIRHGKIQMEFSAHVTEVTNQYVYYQIGNVTKKIKNHFVFAMTGYRPNIPLLKKFGIEIDCETGRPHFDSETYETNLPRIYVAGVVISGFKTSETFIENGRLHGNKIVKAILKK